MKRILLFTLVLIISVFGFSLVLLFDASEKALEQAIGVDDEDNSYVIDKIAGTDKQTEGTAVQNSSTNVNSHSNTAAQSISPTPQLASGGEHANVLFPETNSENQSLAANIDKVKTNMPVTEKVSISAMVLKKLTASDIAELQAMLANGVTAEEKKRAKQIIYSRFTSEEIQLIKEAYLKYSGGN